MGVKNCFFSQDQKLNMRLKMNLSFFSNKTDHSPKTEVPTGIGPNVLKKFLINLL